MVFFINMLKGAGIGASMIIPGVSGGTVAVVENIYNDLIDAICNLRTEFKKSILFLLPIFIGMLLAFVAMYFPLKLALKYIPLPTLLLFCGLMVGSFPKLIFDAKKTGFTKINILSITVPIVILLGICFIPNMAAVDLTGSMPVYRYFILFGLGMLASCALVVPGISGSMILLIFGHYEAILNLFSNIKNYPFHTLLVLVVFGLGIIIGFFSIARVMKYSFEKYNRGTTWAIVGFVLASIPAMFISYDYADVKINALQISLAVILFIVGCSSAFFLIRLSEKKLQKKEDSFIENRI